ncbi:MAG: hypothetical protein HKL90_14395 [Elusimicrobia bacterium]|nr:hypothetical protein [Elusimicrobiota bacterium]
MNMWMIAVTLAASTLINKTAVRKFGKAVNKQKRRILAAVSTTTVVAPASLPVR